MGLSQAFHRNARSTESELMSYTGAVVVSGPGDVRETTDLVITKVAVGSIDNNCYLLRCRATGEQLLVDAADEVPTLLALAGDSGLASIVTTHCHWDHWRALGDMVTATRARTFMGRDDAHEVPVPTDVLLDDEDVVRVGQVDLTVRHLRGHSPGSVALIYRDPASFAHVFTGDSLFPGGVGNTQKDPRRFESLVHDVESKIFDALPDDTWIYPGHGRDTTLGAERPHLASWRARGW